MSSTIPFHASLVWSTFLLVGLRSFVCGRQIARWIVPADGPAVLGRESPACHEFTFRIGLKRLQHVAVRAIEFQRSPFRSDLHGDVSAAPHIRRCTRILSLLQVRCWFAGQEESAGEHDQESANPAECGHFHPFKEASSGVTVFTSLIKKCLLGGGFLS